MTEYSSQDYSNQPLGGKGAELLPRFIARLIDSVVLGVVLMNVIFPLIYSSVLRSAITAALYIGYFAFLESTRGQTLGKMVMKLKTVWSNGQSPSFDVAVKRNAFYALDIIPVVGWLAQLAATLYIAYTINDSDTNTGWHDVFAGGTKVVKI